MGFSGSMSLGRVEALTEAGPGQLATKHSVLLYFTHVPFSLDLLQLFLFTLLLHS